MTTASSEASSESVGGVPKWVLALAVGVPVALGVAYVIFGGDSKPSKKRKAKKSSKVNNGQVAKEHKVTIEDVNEEEEEEDVPDATTKEPLDIALAHKNKGNKYFRAGRYELAIKCYTDAISTCSKDQSVDLSTFYQNRAAAYDQLEKYDAVMEDCNSALTLNGKYVKALDRRSKTLRKLADMEIDLDSKIEKLKGSLEDVTSVCILEGFQKQEHFVLVDAILKELGKAEAARAVKTRQPIMASPYFIQQYFTSFVEDPILKFTLPDSADNERGFLKAKRYFKEEKYEEVIAACDEEIETPDSRYYILAKLMRATFYILSKRQESAMKDLNDVIETVSTKIMSEEEEEEEEEKEESSDIDLIKCKTNALIKRASLYIQRVKDPQKDPELSFNDFTMAEQGDPTNADIYHHRGQVHLLMDQISLAIADFQKSVQLKPDFPIARVQCIFTECRKAINDNNETEMKRCIQMFEESLNKFPDCIEVYALYAQVMSEKQDYAKADELYQRAEKVDPNNANILVHRGLIQLQWNGNVQEGIKLMERALKLDDMCEFAYETLGTVEVQRGNLKRAVELFDKAIPLTNTELELAQLYGLRDAAIAQTKVSEKLGFALSHMGMM